MSQSILARGLADLATKRTAVRRDVRNLLDGLDRAVENRDRDAVRTGIAAIRTKLTVLDGLVDAMASTAEAIVSNTEVPVTTLLEAAKPDETQDAAAEGTDETGPGEQVAGAGSTDTAGTNRRAR